MKTILAKARIGLVRTTQEIRQEFVSIDPGMPGQVRLNRA